MARSITVDPQKLDAASQKMAQQAQEYKTLYDTLYSHVNTMKAGWDGRDNQAYTAQIDGFKPDFEKMYKLMTQYSEFLRDSAKVYKSTQDEVVSQASKLKF